MRIPASMRESLFKEAIKNGMKVLTYDTETSHAIVRTYYIGQKVFITHKQVKVPNKVISIQYKWAHEKKCKYLVWDKISKKYDDSRNFDDSKMIQKFAKNILPKADLVIGQNNDRFDFMVLNERAKALRLSILDVKPSLDILKLSRKSFRAMSHKLDYRSEQQGLGGKIQMVDDDWVDIEERGVPATKKMIPYGCKDTTDTESLAWDELRYYKDMPVAVEKVILSFIDKPKPDLHLIPKVKCPYCKKKEATRQGKRGLKYRYTCLNCGKHFQE